MPDKKPRITNLFDLGREIERNRDDSSPEGLAATFAALARGTEVEKALRARRDRILTDFAEKRAVPTDELLMELVNINIALGES